MNVGKKYNATTFIARENKKAKGCQTKVRSSSMSENRVKSPLCGFWENNKKSTKLNWLKGR